MGVNTDYLGHVEIGPNLNQAENDYLRAFVRSRRSFRPEGPYAVTPEDPHTGNGEREVERYNLVDGLYVELARQPGLRLITTDQRLARVVPVAETINKPHWRYCGAPWIRCSAN